MKVVRKEETRKKKRIERRRVSELTARRSPCLYLTAVDRLLFHFVACEYLKRCPNPSDIDSVTSLFSNEQRRDLYLRVVKAF